jgi:hypothetical protein
LNNKADNLHYDLPFIPAFPMKASIKLSSIQIKKARKASAPFLATETFLASLSFKIKGSDFSAAGKSNYEFDLHYRTIMVMTTPQL